MKRPIDTTAGLRTGVLMILAACLGLILAVPSSAWATFTGDLVYCDLNKNGVFEPGSGDFGIDGVTVHMTCTDRDGVQCLDRTTVSGQTMPIEIGGFGTFNFLCKDLISWDPLGDRTGRYVFDPSLDACAGHSKPWSCEVSVDMTTLPADCNELITPVTGGPPADGNTDGDFCDLQDGPFPEGQTLGDVNGGVSGFTCDQQPDPAPADNKFFPQLGVELCIVYNDFGFTPPQTAQCGNNIIEGTEQCDGTDTGNCLGACDTDCTCLPVCGDGVANGSEQCDSTDTGNCLGACAPDCTCLPICGDGVTNGTEACDGTDDSACPGQCQNDCTCPLCGNVVAEGNEQCDGTDAAACTAGVCQSDCTCGVCGNDTLEQGEQCDGTDDSACAGNCMSDCSCPVCGDNVAEGNAEQCDGTDDSACPGVCLPAGDANQCQCPVCGDGSVNQGSEECDGADATACPGNCTQTCTCPVCGNDILEGTEECDGTDAAACPGACFGPGGDFACRCPFCGDGIVNQPSEVCDPGTNEICNNMVDDDNDGLIDCDDTVDCPQGGTSCGADCLEVMACEKPSSDPARIRFYPDDVSLDFFSMHAQFIPQTHVDPPVDGFSIQVTNADGIVYSGFVRGADFQLKRNGKRFRFRDRGAPGGRGIRDGIYFLTVIKKPKKYAFRLRAFGDFSRVNGPRMTVHVVFGNDGAAVTADWTAIKHGWRLRAADFRNQVGG